MSVELYARIGNSIVVRHVFEHEWMEVCGVKEPVFTPVSSWKQDPDLHGPCVWDLCLDQEYMFSVPGLIERPIDAASEIRAIILIADPISMDEQEFIDGVRSSLDFLFTNLPIHNDLLLDVLDLESQWYDLEAEYMNTHCGCCNGLLHEGEC